MNYKEAYEYGIRTLETAGIEDAKTDTLLLLEDLCHIKRNDIYVHGETLLTKEQEQCLQQAMEKRCRHIPVQHITGIQEFMGLEFNVNENVLIPRQDTEFLVETIMKELHDGSRILDMCTGSGCILLSLLHYSNDCIGVGADISPEALTVARGNATKLGIQAQWVESNLFEAIDGKFDIIVSNPPYIRTDVIETLMEEVKDFEPRIALDGSKDGLSFYRSIVKESKAFLMSGGMLYFEIGYDQAKEVSSIMEQAGFKDITVEQDYAGHDRVVFGTLFGGNTDV